VSSRPDTHLSIVPSVRTTCHTVRTPDRPKHHPSGRHGFPSGHSSASRSFCFSLHPFGRLSSPSERLSVIDTQISFQVHIREDCCNRPDDVDSRPDALTHKARIVIQIQPSGRQSAWSGCTFNRYGNCVFNFNRPDACPSWSGRGLNRYGNFVLKINRPNGHPPWSGPTKAYMEITCSGPATVRTTVPHCPDAALKQERFSAKISEILSHSCPSGRFRSTVRTASVLITAVAH
jgi:hypothetical protein